MFKEKSLKNIGIEAIKKVEDENIISIADKVSTRIKNTFSNSNINYLNIYKTLLETPMYYAKIPQGLSEANYFFKNSTIYFSEDIDLENLSEYVYHECIHKLQEYKNKKGNITRLGICEVNELTVKATALNEGAIQYITSKVIGSEPRIISVYGINLSTKTEYYPLLTNIISGLVYLLGEEILVDSTLNSNENFKIEIIDSIGESEYNTIEKNTNQILKLKNSINNNENEIDDVKEEIKQLYFETQNLIFSSYFNNILKRVENDDEIEMAKKKLFLYENILGNAENYNYYTTYCEYFVENASKKLQDLKNKTALIVIKDNIIFRMFRKIKTLFTKSTNEYYK